MYCSDECKSFMLGTMKRNSDLLVNLPATETECRSWVDSKLRKKDGSLNLDTIQKENRGYAGDRSRVGVYLGCGLIRYELETKTPPQRGKLLFANANLSIIHMIITMGTEAGEVECDEVAPESYNFGIWGA